MRLQEACTGAVNLSALVAGAGNWLLLRRHIRHIRQVAAAGQESALAGHLTPVPDGSPGPATPASTAADQAHRPQQSRSSGPLPTLVIDETDDDGGHRIFYDPWANDRDD